MRHADAGSEQETTKFLSSPVRGAEQIIKIMAAVEADTPVIIGSNQIDPRRAVLVPDPTCTSLALLPADSNRVRNSAWNCTLLEFTAFNGHGLPRRGRSTEAKVHKRTSDTADKVRFWYSLSSLSRARSPARQRAGCRRPNSSTKCRRAWAMSVRFRCARPPRGGPAATETGSGESAGLLRRAVKVDKLSVQSCINFSDRPSLVWDCGKRPFEVILRWLRTAEFAGSPYIFGHALQVVGG